MPYIYRLRTFNFIFCQYLWELNNFIKILDGDKLYYEIYSSHYNTLPSEYKLANSFTDYILNKEKLYTKGIIDLIDFCIKVDIPLDLFLHPAIVIEKWPLMRNTGTLYKELLDTYNKYVISKVRREIHKIHDEPEFKIDSLDNNLQDLVVQYSLGGDFSRLRPNPYRSKINPDMGFSRAGNGKRRSKSPGKPKGKKKSPSKSKGKKKSR
jgi:hypothetical protein